MTSLYTNQRYHEGGDHEWDEGHTELERMPCGRGVLSYGAYPAGVVEGSQDSIRWTTAELSR